MNSIEKLEEIIKSRDIPDWDSQQLEIFKNDIEADLTLFEQIKTVLSGLCHESKIEYGEEDENGFIPMYYKTEIKLGANYDRQLLRDVLNKFGYKLINKDTTYYQYFIFDLAKSNTDLYEWSELYIDEYTCQQEAERIVSTLNDELKQIRYTYTIIKQRINN